MSTSSTPSKWTPGNPEHEKEAKSKLDIWPLDEYNSALLNQVHPRDFTVSKVATEATNNDNESGDFVYDLVAIGAGAGGLVASKQSARRGAKSAMISEKLAGGDCLNVGCVPSKALIRCARAVHQVKKASEFGVSVENVSVDFSKVMEHVRKGRATIAPADGHEGTEQAGTRVYQGRGRLTSPNTIEVTLNSGSDNDTAKTKTIQFKKCVICTGGRPMIPENIPGLQDAPYTTNETLFNLQTLPKHMVILGAGVIALEMAQAFSLLGSQVTVINRSSRLFESKNGDAQAAKIIEEELHKKCGVTFLHSAQVQNVETVKDSNKEDSNLPKMILTVNSKNDDIDKEDTTTLECDCFVVATGRMANVEDLGLENANVEYNIGSGIIVNDLSQSTSNFNIYAVGDCVEGVPRQTHMSGEMAKLVVQNALANDDWRLSSFVVPSVMYTGPEYATVGKTFSLEMAQAQNIMVDVYTGELTHNDRAILEGSNVGFCKIICAKGTDTILGATIVAERAGEMINEISLAIKHNIGLHGIGRNIHAYPTTGEAVQSCGVQYINSKLSRFDWNERYR